MPFGRLTLYNPGTKSTDGASWVFALQIEYAENVGLFDFLNSSSGASQPSSPQTDTVRQIVTQLDQLEPERARHLAAFGYILARLARADLRVSPEETRAMERAIIEHGQIPEEQAIIVVQIAKNQNALFGGTEDFLVTREFNKIASREQKLALIDCLYFVAASEHRISVTEDNEIRQIASELRLEHPEIIAVRSRYRDALSVFKET
jgi:uncharacterized tellurite resistance protein B-like protein